VVEKFRKRLSANKRAAQKTDVDRFTLNKVSEVDARKEYQVNISNTFTVLVN
jgi:hypothetical protein